MHYQRGKDRDQVFMTSMDQMVDPDSWARVVDLFVDALPITELGFTNSQLKQEGNLPYHPADLFKLLLYGYRHGIRSAPKLAKACQINVEVIWLLKGLRPSPRTINYFRADNGQAIEKAHRHFVRLLKQWKLIDGQVMAVDGTKIRGQNSLKNNFNAKKIQRHLDYIDGKIGDYLAQLDELEDEAPSRKRSKQVGELQDKINTQQERRERYEKLAEQVAQSPDGQVSLTDPHARAVIKHRNIVEVGYNIQATVDAKHKLIVDVFAGGVNDVNELGRAGQRAQLISGVQKIDLLADAGYHNGAQLAYCERRGVRPFVAPRRNHPQKKPGFQKVDFLYDPASDTYTCPAGARLNHTTTFKRNTSKPYRVKRYTTPDCETCKKRNSCTSSPNGRYIERPLHQPYTERNDRRVHRYKDFYRSRQIISEHIFGTWKRPWGMTYTLLKGNEKVETEYRITAICYNLLRTIHILGAEKLRKALRVLLATFFAFLRLFCKLYTGRYLFYSLT